MPSPDPKNNYHDKVLCAIQEVQEYIRYSEMGGELDFDDPWYPTWSSLRELMLKVSDEKEMDEGIGGIYEDYPDGPITQGDKKLLDIITKQKEGN
jgi:hypothetical protein